MEINQPIEKVDDGEQGREDARRATSHLLKDLGEEQTVLLAAKAKEEALLESIGDGVIGTDQEGRITVMNTAAKNILGWTAEEVMGKNLYEIVVVEDEQGRTVLKNKRTVSTVFASGEAISIASTYYVSKDEKRIPVAINVTPILLDGKIIGTVNVFRDITKEKELENAKDDFISLASHQLRSPITAISWNLEMLLNGSKGPLTDDQREMLQRIYKSSKNMAELVGGFLDVTKMESNKFDIEPGDVNLVQIADSVLEELMKQIAEKKTSIVKQYGTDIPNLNIGTKTARVIFQNLLTNAIKYTAEKGVVEITIQKTGEGISIAIKDNGYGIPEASKGQIFTKLFRAGNIREQEPTGTGLGLYLLKSLVDKLGGKVWFESKEGVGSTFYVNLK